MIIERELNNPAKKLDRKNPRDINGENLLINYARYDCEEGIEELLKKGADPNVKSFDGISLLSIVIEKKLTRIFSLLLENDVDLTIIKGKKSLITHIQDSNDDKLIEALLSSDKPDIGVRQRLSFATKAIEFANLGNFTLAEKILGYIGTLHPENRDISVAKTLEKADISQEGRKWFLGLEEQLIEEIYLKFTDQKIIPIKARIVEQFKTLRIMTKGQIQKKTMSSDYIGSKTKPLDLTSLDIWTDEFIGLVSILETRTSPEGMTKRELVFHDRILELLELDTHVSLYYSIAESLRKQHTIVLEWLEKVQLLACEIDKRHQDNQLEVNLDSPAVYTLLLPENLACIKSIRLTGEFNDQVSGITNQSKVHVLVKTKRTVFHEILYVIDRTKGTEVNILFDGKDDFLNLFSVKMNGAEICLVGSTPVWNGCEYHSRNVRLEISYFEKPKELKYILRQE